MKTIELPDGVSQFSISKETPTGASLYRVKVNHHDLTVAVVKIAGRPRFLCECGRTDCRHATLLRAELERRAEEANPFESCPSCRGSGRVSSPMTSRLGYASCGACRGRGQVRKAEAAAA